MRPIAFRPTCCHPVQSRFCSALETPRRRLLRAPLRHHPSRCEACPVSTASTPSPLPESQPQRPSQSASRALWRRRDLQTAGSCRSNERREPYSGRLPRDPATSAPSEASQRQRQRESCPCCYREWRRRGPDEEACRVQRWRHGSQTRTGDRSALPPGAEADCPESPAAGPSQRQEGSCASGPSVAWRRGEASPERTSARPTSC